MSRWGVISSSKVDPAELWACSTATCRILSGSEEILHLLRPFFEGQAVGLLLCRSAGSDAKHPKPETVKTCLCCDHAGPG